MPPTPMPFADVERHYRDLRRECAYRRPIEERRQCMLAKVEAFLAELGKHDASARAHMVELIRFDLRAGPTPAVRDLLREALAAVNAARDAAGDT